MASIDEVHTLCTKILCEIATINQRCKAHDKITAGHHLTLYGPEGKSGIVATVNKLNGINRSRKEWALRIISPIISGLIVAAVLTALYIWKTNGYTTTKQAQRTEQSSERTDGDDFRYQ